MSQIQTVKPTLSQPIFPINIRNVNEIFPGFELGDFALLQGSSSIASLTSLLCVRAQLPTQLGGLQSNIIFIDGANTFSLYQIAKLAQIHHLNPKKVLDRIIISRAFTAHQTTTLITNQLKETIKKYNAKLVIISDIAGLFLDNDIPEVETQKIFNQVITFLSNFAREQQVIVIATYPTHPKTERNTLLHASTSSKANVVLSLSRTSYARQFVLEKHPYLSSGVSEVPFEDSTLDPYLEANA